MVPSERIYNLLLGSPGRATEELKFEVTRGIYVGVPARDNGFYQDTSVFSTIRVTGSIPKFLSPDKLSEEEIKKC